MTRNVALGQPTVGEEELAAVAGVFESGWLSGAGPACLGLEADFAQVAGVPHVLATSNCGSALHLALLALGAGPGDEVIVGDYTFPATGHSVMWTGAKPVFADVRPDIWSMDPAAVEAAITPRTVGIVAVDVFGQPADYDELRAIADKHGLWLVEDAACAAGATYKGRPAGSLADVAAFSFHGRKGITAGEGGALVSARADLVDHARKLHTYGIAPAIVRDASTELPVPSFDELGYNYRLSDISAAIMRVQVRRLPQLLENRTKAAAGYATLLGDLEQVTLPVELEDRTHPWQSYVLTLDPGLDRGAVALALRSRGVGCNFGTYASHVQPLYGATEACPVSADLFARHIAIPMHANLTDDDVEYVAQVVREVVSTAATTRR
ncbi:DegT/DnrJ/EryC1/StrS family aminotransferase [Cellulosimicrobium cellulans]|uniref:DegT/DnrJ/EryC1/StrS family aminotransferase n=1 Tax=Cellulosimicrobium funkei TaxID=264251 RepID=A0A4Y8R0E0_9MICO|nr:MULTISPECIES: DegT/DnrJ/EryC1/StrS family aminotransferase [Cellulosimicrobium]MCM3534316.1 DegT/DnrJ/EryC1/StrS family aminotransferase [Cellulosimicrobium funkei]MDQ8042456.1 DegT/DnrJ/EryC1/StrS family aminotransferase [Cellulosimicrobium sp. XJ-DQ-B-000]TFF08576.1 DegT/DnrJ/EryC1/StrS family aminotransferase [Cellulosimicrobium funkei]TGA72968.1 DegT/DnrJ/EryC1/StrS family aminotransferase [Cellulosimicrobium terreum]